MDPFTRTCQQELAYNCSVRIQDVCIYQLLHHEQDVTQCQLFQRSSTGFHSEFSFSKTSCHTKAEEPKLPYNLTIARETITEFVRFPSVLVLCEMPTTSSRIWTRVAMSISYDDNHYTTDTGRNLEDQLGATDDRDGWRDGESGNLC